MIERPLDDAFSADIVRVDGRARVVVRGELDLASAADAMAVLMDALRAGTPVDVDLEGVTFLDSSGLQALVAARKDADRQGVPMAVVAVSEPVERVLQLTQTGDWLRES